MLKLISSILDFFNPAGIAFKLLIAGVAAVGLMWAWAGFKDWVSAPAVAKAESAVHAVYTPKFEALTAEFKSIEKNIIDSRLAAKKAADEAIAKEKDRADQATAKYKGQVRVVKEMAADRQAVLVDFNQLPHSMWNIEDIVAANDGSGTGIVRLSGYTRRLIKRYESCERDLNEAIGVAAQAVDRAAIRGAAVEALKR